MKSEKIAKDRKNMEEKKIVEVKKLKKQYGDNIILKNINLHINKGEVVSLIGPSGSGKNKEGNAAKNWNGFSNI